MSMRQTLRHVYHHGVYHHGVYQYPGLLRRADIFSSTTNTAGPSDDDNDDNPDEVSAAVGPARFLVHPRRAQIQRIDNRQRANVDRLLELTLLAGPAAAAAAAAAAETSSSEWVVENVAAPNVSDKETVLSFARMAANAYTFEPHTGDWQDVGGGFNYTEDFGWQKDGLRGHVFADAENKTIVISIKGTSFSFFGGGGSGNTDPATKDQLNDNLLGSCCCGQGGQYWWKRVCACQTSEAYTCNNTCLSHSLREKSRYYHAARDIYHNITADYPTATVWLVGHSLGGVLASLLGLTYGLPTVTFEAFPDSLAASRLGLPTPPGHRIGSGQQMKLGTPISHFGHTADPVFMGSCNAAASSCTLAGYAFQSQCHTGRRCVYDTVGDLGWRVNINTHRILRVILDVLERYEGVPVCEQDVDCIDCFEWKFLEGDNGTVGGNHTVSSTKTTTTTTTTTMTTTTMTETSSTTTCETPGWWGCRDQTTTVEKEEVTRIFTAALFVNCD